MNSEKINLTRKVTVRLKPAEYNKVHTAFKQTTKRKLSEYIRYVLLDKPVTVFTRSKSMDELVQELVLLRNELSAIGNNFNQSVKRLHTLDHFPEIKSWALHNEKSKEIFMHKINEIHLHIVQISDRWSQE